MTAEWLIPTVVFILVTGSLGITSKLALKTMGWQDLLLWSGIGYILLVGVLVAIGQSHVKFVTGSGWAAFSAVLAITGLFAIYFALSNGPAGKVIPIGAAYPAVTLILAVIFLSERLTVPKAGGVALVIIGVVVLTRAE
jgi:uncharacterized membrane protein